MLSTSRWTTRDSVSQIFVPFYIIMNSPPIGSITRRKWHLSHCQLLPDWKVRCNMTNTCMRLGTDARDFQASEKHTLELFLLNRAFYCCLSCCMAGLAARWVPPDATWSTTSCKSITGWETLLQGLDTISWANISLRRYLWREDMPKETYAWGKILVFWVSLKIFVQSKIKKLLKSTHTHTCTPQNSVFGSLKNPSPWHTPSQNLHFCRQPIRDWCVTWKTPVCIYQWYFPPTSSFEDHIHHACPELLHAYKKDSEIDLLMPQWCRLWLAGMGLRPVLAK